MTVQHAERGELKRGETVPRRQLADGGEDELVEPRDRVRDPRLGGGVRLGSFRVRS